MVIDTNETFAELKERLWRPKFDRYVAMERRKALLADIESIALSVDVPPAMPLMTSSSIRRWRRNLPGW